MRKAFVCTSLGLWRCIFGCLFFGGCYEKVKGIFFKRRNGFVEFFGNGYYRFVLCFWQNELYDIMCVVNIIPSTLSVTTSFLAVYLTFRRSPYFALAYAANDIVLIILWIWASMYDARYISVVVCFIAFLVNDIYGFISWRKMKIRQQENLLRGSISWKVLTKKKNNPIMKTRGDYR